MVTRIRHNGCVPSLRGEGVFVKSIKVYGHENEKSWKESLTPWQRLSSHYTLSSTRRFCGFIPIKAPKDELDFILHSQYQHNLECFPDKCDIYLQLETIGKPTWRNLRNDVEFKPEPHVYLEHPLFIGGITKKNNPYNVKLMNSGHHSPQTNAGYSRQDRDGNVFLY